MIGTIILGVGLIAVATGNLIITNLNIKTHKVLEKRIENLKWQIDYNYQIIHLILKEENLEIVLNEDIYKTGEKIDNLIFGLKKKENK